MSSSRYPRPANRNAFNVAIICALERESNAVEASFDEFWEDETQGHYGKAPRDSNAYTLGRIGRHNVVLAYLPGMGKTHSASAAASLVSSFPEIRLGLVVGICGAVPIPPDGDEIFLGDVIISTEVIQTDFGRQYSNNFIRKDTLRDNFGRPNPEIRAFVRKIGGFRGRPLLRKEVETNIRAICGRRAFRKWSRPPIESDILFNPTYRHKHQDPAACDVCAQCLGDDKPVCERALDSDCTKLGCSHDQIIPWSERNREVESEDSDMDNETHVSEETPAIHFGPVASSDSVMKSASHRDTIAQETNAIAFEMEGAGTWDNFPTIVVKAACDYADSHKNKIWQRYAAVSAAAATKALLSQWSGNDQPVTSFSFAQGQRVGSDDTEDESMAAMFINHGPVGNQAKNQTVHGGMFFGAAPPDPLDYDRRSQSRPQPQRPAQPQPRQQPPQQQQAHFQGGTNYGSQIGFNSGYVSNHHHAASPNDGSFNDPRPFAHPMFSSYSMRGRNPTEIEAKHGPSEPDLTARLRRQESSNGPLTPAGDSDEDMEDSYSRNQRFFEAGGAAGRQNSTTDAAVDHPARPQYRSLFEGHPFFKSIP